MESDKLLFSGEEHADIYAKYRPVSPEELHLAIVNYCSAGDDNVNLELALDIGCGSGQNTLVLSPHFKKVIGLDVSEAQINQAKLLYEKSHKNIEFEVSSAEDLPTIKDASVDLATFATCFHWLDAEKTCMEMERVLKPGGAMAVYCMGMPFTSVEEASNILKKLDTETLAKYWSPRKWLINNTYKDISLPFRDLVRDVDSYKIHRKMPLSGLIGYLQSWSGYQGYLKENPAGTSLEEVEQSIREIYQKKSGSDVQDIEVEITWPIYLLMGRK